MSRTIDAVGAAILRNGFVLCAKRNRSAVLPGLWEFPGGKINPGETPAAALEREIREELLADVWVGDLIRSTVYEYPFGQVVLATFYCDLLSADVTPTEHEAIIWLQPEDLATLDWAPADLPTVQVLRGRLAAHPGSNSCFTPDAEEPS